MAGVLDGLLSKNDRKVDTIHLLGGAGFISLVLFTGYALVHGGDYGPLQYAGALGTLLTAIGGGRRLRDGPCRDAAPDATPEDRADAEDQAK